MRITAGEFRNRKVSVADLPKLRPTPAKARQALFNMLPHYLDVEPEHASMLELYAGSGIMALEALSRGFKQVVSMEVERIACRNMQQQATRLNISKERWCIHQARLPNALQHCQQQHFSLVFADPPYGNGDAIKLPAWLSQQNIHFDLLVVEEATSAVPDWSAVALENLMVRRYGNSSLSLFRPLESKT